MTLIADVLWDCDRLTDKEQTELIIPLNVLFYGLNYMIWLAVLMFPLTLSVVELASMPKKFIGIGLGCLYAIVSLIWLGEIITSCKRILDTDPLGFSYGPRHSALYTAWQGLYATWTVLYFVATLAATAILITAIIKLRGNSAMTGVCLTNPLTHC